MTGECKLDLIGEWSKDKLEIVKAYAKEYAKIIANQEQPFYFIYIDAFAGAGKHISKKTGEFVLGSPVNALNIKPYFKEYYFIETNPQKVKELKKIAEERKRDQKINVLAGDCNKILPDKVFPNIKWSEYKRGLCFLDPYGLHLDWSIIETAGKMRSIEIFLNFPIYDMNLNVLLKDKDKVDPRDKLRMDRFWGDESWQDLPYRLQRQQNFFGEEKEEKIPEAIETITGAFRQRLKKAAQFKYVPEPIAMCNTSGNILYYIYFATNNEKGNGIVTWLFDKYRKPKG